jgi:hypothetical protein
MITTARRMLLLITALGFFPAFAAAESKTVRDWTGDCDDDLTCMATASGAGGMAMGETGYRLRFSRAEGDMSAWSMRFFLKNVPQPKADGEMVVSVDGGAALSFYEEYGYLRDADGITFGIAGGNDLDKLFAAVKKGQKLTLSYETTDGKTQKETFSLSGLAAILLWVDEQQNRLGKSSEITFPPGVEGEATFTATKEVTDKIAARVKFDCETPVPNRPDIESYRMPGGFALHIAPCFAGAYNFTQLYFFQRRDDLQLVYFADYYEGWSGTNQLFNSDFNPRTGRLGAFYKGRGIGDCGSAGQWVWSGYSFKLTEFSAWPGCDNGRSSDDWPIVYKRQAK